MTPREIWECSNCGGLFRADENCSCDRPNWNGEASQAALFAAGFSIVKMEDLEREIEQNVKAHIRLAFRKALSDLPEIAPADVVSVLSSVLMRDEFLLEGKRLQMEHGVSAVAPRVEQECGAGAWSFMREGVLHALKGAKP